MGVEFWHQAQVRPAKAERGDVQENKGNSEVASHALKGVSPRPVPTVPVDVDFPRPGKDDSQGGVECNGPKKDRPLNDLEGGKRMDEIHLVLEGLDARVSILGFSKEPSPDDGRVGGEVGEQKKANWKDPRETVQTAK